MWQDHYPGRAGEIVDQLSTDELIALATGDPAKDQGASALGSAGQTVPGAAAETVNVAEKDPYNVASIVLADGPAGLRLRSEYQVEALTAEIFWMALKMAILRSRRSRPERYIISIVPQSQLVLYWHRAGIWI